MKPNLNAKENEKLYTMRWWYSIRNLCWQNSFIYQLTNQCCVQSKTISRTHNRYQFLLFVHAIYSTQHGKQYMCIYVFLPVEIVMRSSHNTSNKNNNSKCCELLKEKSKLSIKKRLCVCGCCFHILSAFECKKNSLSSSLIFSCVCVCVCACARHKKDFQSATRLSQLPQSFY